LNKESGATEIVKKQIETYFKGAVVNTNVEKAVFNNLSSLGFEVENTLFSDSICPDEINRNNH
jgi:hypothetical protein